MGMPVTIDVVDSSVTANDLNRIFDYFVYIDQTFSTYKPQSEIMRYNRGEVTDASASPDMATILTLAELTKSQTDGYFDIGQPGHYDPSGVVKGWAIQQAANQLLDAGFENFSIEAGGDMQVHGHNRSGQPWHVGIRNPFKPSENVKILVVTDCGVATSGTYERGEHIYNPKAGYTPTAELVSLTVVGPNICDADRYATAAFAMGQKGLPFIENLPNYEAYGIHHSGTGIMTTHFNSLCNDRL